MKDLAIIVPYRDREEHLEQFIPYMKGYLTKKGFSFDFYIVEQEEGKPFNRGMLLNIGYELANKKGSYKSIVLHDIDMLPVNVDYSEDQEPTHLLTEVEQFDWKIPYELYFGGILLFPNEVFKKINGYSNQYWGWGCEDDDIFYRVQYSGIPWKRRQGKVNCLTHGYSQDKEDSIKNNEDTMRKAWKVDLNWMDQGLNTLKYRILEDKTSKDYSMYRVSI